MTAASFADRLIAWHTHAGRHDLPWQHPATPYRVWVSEVMLQQTQVATVIPYFERWMTRLADLPALAGAPLEDVLALWSGLGYYARARNLHTAARQCMDRHAGALPHDLAALMALPGIGRSTAGAILALGSGIRAPILDGNVRRVLARHRAIAGWPGTPVVTQRLWQAADAFTPAPQVGTYTQAIMDLGATVCTARAPRCPTCPVAHDCLARAAGTVQAHPAPRPTRVLARRDITVLVLRNAHGAVLLERRPPAGIWGGLWSLPEQPHPVQPDLADLCERRFGVCLLDQTTHPPLRHTLTHLHLHLHPLMARTAPACAALEGAGQLWYNPATDRPPGLPAPVRRLIAQLCSPPDAPASGAAPR